MIAPLLLALLFVLGGAKLGAALAERLGQPAVLGEILAGILLGALPLAGVDGLAFVAGDHAIEALAELGVLLLLFEVGLHVKLADLVRVGGSSSLVALIGVAMPMAGGVAVGRWLLPEAHWFVALFLGATLCATSVGITARVLKDLGRLQTAEGRIILGAAVIDDVLGLVVLAVLVGMAGGGARPPVLQAALVAAKAAAFLGAALLLGRMAAPRLFALASRLRGTGVVFTLSLLVCFGLSWAADAAGLAPIVGAFAAGLVLEGVDFERMLPEGDTLENLLLPLSTVLVPIFFVRMGMAVDLRALAAGPVLLPLALTLVALAGKQACSLGVLTRGADRWAVGFGMIPRGEVGLIFAGIGLRLTVGGRPVLGPGEFAAVVVMVLATTIVAPALLRWRLMRSPARPA